MKSITKVADPRAGHAIEPALQRRVDVSRRVERRPRVGRIRAPETMTLKTLKQKVSGLRSGEDRGVSPVIGIVLMVAITVVLAAVIGAFVLGMGDGIGDSAAPNAQLSISEEGGDVVLEHNGGDSINLSEFTIVGDDNENSDFPEGESELNAGETAPLGSVSGDIEIRHDPSGSILASGTVDGDDGGD